MKQFYVFVVALSILSCKNDNANEIENKKTPEVIVHDEYAGEEPTKPEETEIYKPVPPTVNKIGKSGVPSDAIVLFDNDLSEWESVKNPSKPAEWIVNADSSFTVKNKAGNIRTKKEFGNVQLHVEWMSPSEIQGENQSRANSGIFLQERYEVQVLDNNDNDTYVNGQVGSIYKQHVPLAKASVPSGEWNSYDIIYHAPEFNKRGEKTKSATITVLHNGILVQDHVEIKGATAYIGWPKNEAHGKAPIVLQDHGDNSRVSYRNIWVRELN